jgi:hypothetical protein
MKKDVRREIASSWADRAGLRSVTGGLELQQEFHGAKPDNKFRAATYLGVDLPRALACLPSIPIHRGPDKPEQGRACCNRGVCALWDLPAMLHWAKGSHL